MFKRESNMAYGCSEPLIKKPSDRIEDPALRLASFDVCKSSDLSLNIV